MSEEKSLTRISSGVDGLDAVLGSGLVAGSVYVISGPPGAGKTILANQICFRQAKGGSKCLYVTLLAEVHERILRFLSPLSFFDEALIPEDIYYVSGYRVLVDEGVDGLLKLLLEEMRRLQTKMLVIDGLFVARELSGTEHQYRRFVHALQGQAAITGCTVLMITNESDESNRPEYIVADGWLDLGDLLEGARSVRFLVVRKQRGSGYLSGRHFFRITDSGITVFPRVDVYFTGRPSSAETTDRVTTGIAGLDRMTEGGYPFGSTTMVLGPPGSGKTTVGLQFLSRCSPEASGVLLSFYEDAYRLKLKAGSIGIDLHSLVSRAAVDIIWHPPANVLPDEVGHELVGKVKQCNAKRVFIDGISALQQTFVTPWRLPLFLSSMSNYLQSIGVTSVFTMEIPTLFMPETVEGQNVFSLIDNLVLLHYMRSEDIVSRKISILKIRDTSFDPVTEDFHIARSGIQFGPSPIKDRPKAAPKRSRPVRPGARKGR